MNLIFESEHAHAQLGREQGELGAIRGRRKEACLGVAGLTRCLAMSTLGCQAFNEAIEQPFIEMGNPARERSA